MRIFSLFDSLRRKREALEQQMANDQAQAVFNAGHGNVQVPDDIRIEKGYDLMRRECLLRFRKLATQ